MNTEELRAHYDLKPCTNSHHDFKFGRVIGNWQWANDNWSQLVGDKLQTLHLALHTTQNLKGNKIYSFTIFKFKLIFGWV